MSLNGEPLEMETVNVFSLLDRVADELKLADAFLGLKGMDHAVVRKLMRMRVAKGGANANVRAEKLALDFPRLDVVRPELDPSSPRFANDVEKDRAFKSWDPSLSGLLLPGPPAAAARAAQPAQLRRGRPAGRRPRGRRGRTRRRRRGRWWTALDRAAEQGVAGSASERTRCSAATTPLATPTPLTTRTTERATPTCPPASASPRRWPARTPRWRAGSGGRYAGEFVRGRRARAAGDVGGPARAPARAGRPRRGARVARVRAGAQARLQSGPRRRSGGRGHLEESGWTKMDEERSDADFEATLAGRASRRRRRRRGGVDRRGARVFA